MCSLSRREGLPAEAPGQSRVIKSKSCESPKTVCDGCACVSQERFTRHTRPLQPEFGAQKKKQIAAFHHPSAFFSFLIYSLKLYVTRASCARYIPNCCRVHLLSPINSGGGGGRGWRSEEPNTQISLDAAPPACTDLNTTISLAAVP